MNHLSLLFSRRDFSALLVRASFFGMAVTLLSGHASVAGAGVANRLLADFEDTSTSGAAPIDGTNSAATGASGSAVTNVAEGGSRRVRLTDNDGGTNGFVLTIPGAIPGPGNWLVTADVKVADTPVAPITSFGMGAVIGEPSTMPISDTHGGYVMNLTPGSSASLGYQTIGAAVQIQSGPFPQPLTVYFSTNPTTSNYSHPGTPGNPGPVYPTTDGSHRFEHRVQGGATWGPGSANAVYVDNVRIIGPGRFGEDRHYWVSAGNSYNNLARVQGYIDIARDNGFNIIDILARYRSDAYYVPNRDFPTDPINPEPFGTLVGGGTPGPQNDPLQYLVDHTHEQGMKAYISFSSFLATAGSTYPSHLPAGSQTWIYNGGSPRAQLSTDTGEGIWADVGRADVRAHLLTVLRDIVRNYDIDGVIFDRIRYADGGQAGYNPVALEEMGYAAGEVPHPSDPVFIQKRRDNVTRFLHDAYEMVTDMKPWVVVGTVPVVYGYNFQSTYSSVFQFYPGWTAVPTRNRAFSFGAQDSMQPQLYRSAGTSFEAYNSHYIDFLRYGDLTSLARDYGMFPGASCNLEPLFYHPSTGSTAQSNLNAQNLCDARNKEMSGGGIYSADTVRTDMRLIRLASTTCGRDALSGFPEHSDFLMKAGYDNTPPNAVTGLAAATPASLTTELTWVAPATADDGETASRFLIYRGSSPGVRTYYATLRNKATTVTATGFIDTVPEGGNYWYRVVAVDRYNNRSQGVEIGPVSVGGPAALSAPAAPANVQTFVLGNVVNLTWNDTSNNELSFEVERDGATVATLSEGIAAFSDEDVPAGSHTWRVRAVNGAGASAWVSVLATAASSVAKPSGLTASNAGGAAVLTWTDSATNESSVEIFRAESVGGPFIQIATASPDSTAWADTGLSPGTWHYRIRACNGQAYSLRSDTATVTVTPAAPPAAPITLSASAGTTTIALTWQDQSDNETGFEIWRGTLEGGPYTLLTTTVSNITSYIDSHSSAGTYYYVVRAVNLNGQSSFTNEASGTIQLPASPVLTAVPGAGGTTVTLNWIGNSGAASFQVYRATAPGGPHTLLATLPASSSTYVDDAVLYATDTSWNGTFYYVVRGMNALGTGPASNEAPAALSWVPDILLESRTPTGALSARYSEGITTGGIWADTTAKSRVKYPAVRGLGARWTGDASNGSYAVYTPEIFVHGVYEILVTGPNGTVGPNVNSPGTLVEVLSNGSTLDTRTYNNSRLNPALVDQWMPFTPTPLEVEFPVGAGRSIRMTNMNPLSANTGQRFNIDAIRLRFIRQVPVTMSGWTVE